METISVYGISRTPYDDQKNTFLEKLKIAERELIKCLMSEGVGRHQEEQIKKTFSKLIKIEKTFTDGD